MQIRISTSEDTGFLSPADLDKFKSAFAAKFGEKLGNLTVSTGENRNGVFVKVTCPVSAGQGLAKLALTLLMFKAVFYAHSGSETGYVSGDLGLEWTNKSGSNGYNFGSATKDQNGHWICIPR